MLVSLMQLCTCSPFQIIGFFKYFLLKYYKYCLVFPLFGFGLSKFIPGVAGGEKRSWQTEKGEVDSTYDGRSCISCGCTATCFYLLYFFLLVPSLVTNLSSTNVRAQFDSRLVLSVFTPIADEY